MELAFAPVAAVAVAADLGVELRLFAPSRSPRRGEAILWSTGWLLLSVAVATGIALTGGPAGEWTTVYLIERSLSLDNVFLFSLLLAYFLVPTDREAESSSSASPARFCFAAWRSPPG